MEVEKTHGVGYGSSGFTDSISDLVLFHRELFVEADVSSSFFNGIEVFPLKVLDECHF